MTGPSGSQQVAPGFWANLTGRKSNAVCQCDKCQNFKLNSQMRNVSNFIFYSEVKLDR